MLWREARQRKGEREGSKSEAEVLHAVTHGGGWGDPFGFHYTSVDGGFTWVAHSRAKVYQNVVEMGGTRMGEKKILSRRERPHVVLDKRGTLLALTNGVSEAWPCRG